MESINVVIPDFYIGGGSDQDRGKDNISRKLQKNILFTLAYYASQDYPLSSFETWRHMHDFSGTGKIDFFEVILGLENLKKRKIIKNHKGFWIFTNDRLSVSDERLARQKISSREIKKALKWAKMASFLPYLKGIFCIGTLGMKKAGANSDWDVLVVLRRDRIWFGRLLLSLFFQAFGKRRTDKKIKGRFCLNHFLTENGLIMEEQNHYSSKEISFSYPLVGNGKFHKFMQLNEFWVNKFLPNFERDKIYLMSSQGQIGNFRVEIRNFLEHALEFFNFGKLIDGLCRSVMVAKIKKNEKTYYKGADVRYNDQALVFLPKPQRDMLIDKTLKRLTKISV